MIFVVNHNEHFLSRLRSQLEIVKASDEVALAAGDAWLILSLFMCLGGL